MAEDNGNIGLMDEIGSTGLHRFSGIISEEFLKVLTGRKGIKVYKEMRDNDPVIGAILFAISMLIRNVEWRVESAEPGNVQADDIAEFIDSCRDDMEHTWSEFIDEILSMLPFGWATHELIYKQRLGPEQTGPESRSKFEDGLVGWRKIPLRSQDTLDRWNFTENGDIESYVQQNPVTFDLVTIPMEKTLLFRTTSHKNNPEGRSVIRNAYRPWYFKKRIEEIEGIGIERDLAGLPVALVPPQILASTASAEEKATLAAIKTIIRNIRRDEQEGVVFPLVYDADGNKLYELELLSTGGSRQFDTSEIIGRYDKRIAMTVLADFILLGQDKVGSFALSSDKTKLFATSIGALLNSISDVINRNAVTRLLQLNGMPLELAPKILPGDLEKKNIKEFLEALNDAIGSGTITADENTEQAARDILDIPSLDPEFTPPENDEDL